jgi:predicted nucleic acid-binding protein
VILLDTNIFSGLMREPRDPAVVRWLDSLAPEDIWTTAITVFEVQMGLELLPPGRRRRELEDAFASTINREFLDRVASFDHQAALSAGRIAAEQRRAGRSREVRDLQIAAIADARQAAVATRNLRHFEGLGLKLIDPWSH